MSPARLVATLLVLSSLFLVPWWGAALAITVLTLYFRGYYEAILLGFMLDALYALRGTDAAFGFPFTLYCTALVFAARYVRDYLRVST